jgi:two-component system chemotaxis sensor kinase CheA
MTDFLDNFLDDYFAEAEEHLSVIRRDLLALEKSVGQPALDGALIEELFRSFHSLKGVAGMVDHRETEAMAHELEQALRGIREGDTILTASRVDALMKGASVLESTIVARRAGEPPRDVSAAIEELHAGLAPEAPDTATVAPPAEPQNGAANWLCTFTPSPVLVARGVNVDAVRTRLREAGEIVRATPAVTADGAVAFRFEVRGVITAAMREAWAADGMQISALEAESSPSEAATGPREVEPTSVLSSGHYARVDLARLDDLMRMIGNLVILRSRLHDSVERAEVHLPAAEYRAIQDDADAIERELRELRDGVMRVRLVPVGEIFRRMPFVVRDLARESDKSVHVVLSGQDTKIDKFLVERMMDPVLHLVRNAVSHGIELPERRRDGGKPPLATVRLSAVASGETVVIEVADDGAGIDAERVATRARQSGLTVPDTLDNAALLDLISAPGFSTRDTTDRVSGRGFGMNVVRETINELGGTIRLQNDAGQGTKFTIELPLTLAITAAMIARVGNEVFAVPQAAVREVAEFESEKIQSVPGAEVVEHRGCALPVVRLSTILGVDAAPAARQHAFVIGTGSAAVALLVDRIVGHREIVVRATADPLIRVGAVAGATDLGDGRAVLILNAAAIARAARGQAGLMRHIA